MNHFTAGLSLAFALVTMGCGGSQKPKTPAGPTCADAAANIEKQIIDAGKQADPPVDMSGLGSIAREIMAERCPADGWSKEALACLARATTEEMEGCSKLLTPAQNEALEQAMKARLDSMSDEDKARMMGTDDKAMAPAAGAAPPKPDDPCGGDE